MVTHAITVLRAGIVHAVDAVAPMTVEIAEIAVVGLNEIAPDIAEKLEKELEQIITGNDALEEDRFRTLVTNCEIIDYDKSTRMEPVFRFAAKRMAKSFDGLSTKEMYEKLIAREQSSSTALKPFFALPHIVTPGKNEFEMLIVRSKHGVAFTEAAPEVHALFFLAGSIDQRHFHLVVLSTLALIVNHPSFEESWMAARSAQDLRDLILRIKELTGK